MNKNKTNREDCIRAISFYSIVVLVIIMVIGEIIFDIISISPILFGLYTIATVLFLTSIKRLSENRILIFVIGLIGMELIAGLFYFGVFGIELLISKLSAGL